MKGGGNNNNYGIAKGKIQFNPISSKGNGKVAPYDDKGKVSTTLPVKASANISSWDADGDEVDAMLGFDAEDGKQEHIENIFEELEGLEMINIDGEGNVSRKADKKNKKREDDDGAIGWKDNEDKDSDTDLGFALHEDDKDNKSSLSADVEEKFEQVLKQYVDTKAKNKKMAEKLKKLREEMKGVMDQLEKKELELIDLQKKQNRAGALGRTVLGPGGKNDLDKEQRKVDEERARMLNNPDGLEGEMFSLNSFEGNSSAFTRLLNQFNKYWEKHKPLNKDVKSIEARFGSSVAAYFRFFRWIFGTFAFVFVCASIFLIYHVRNLLTAQSETSNSSQLGISGIYQYRWTSALRKWVNEDRRAKIAELIEAEEGKSRFAEITLSAWDFAKTNKQEVEEYMYFLAEDWGTILTEEKEKGKVKSRSQREKYILLARQATGFLLYVAIQVGSASLIIYLTTQTTALNDYLLTTFAAYSTQITSLGLPAIVVTAVITTINSITPKLVDMISAFEKYDTVGFQIKLKLFRLFIARALMTSILAVTMMTYIDPYLFRETPIVGLIPISSNYASIRLSMQKKFVMTEGSLSSDKKTFTSQPQCRFDQLTHAMMISLLTDFLLSKITDGLIPFVTLQISKLRKKPFTKTEFSVPVMMVGMLNTQLLSFILLPFSPFASLVITIMLYINFKWDKLRLNLFMQKPKKPWSARDSGAFLIKFYLVCVIFFNLISIYFFLNLTFPKSCDKMQSMYDSRYGGSSDITAIFPGPGSLERAKTVFEEEDFWTNLNGATTSPIGFTAASTSLGITQSYYNVSSYLSGVTYTKNFLNITTSCSQDRNVIYFCSMACGPFIYSTYSLAPIMMYFTSNAVLKYPYYIAVENPFFVWAFVVTMTTLWLFQKNSLAVARDLHVARQKVLDDEITELEKKNNVLTKKIKKYEVALEKSAAGTSL